MSSYHHSIHQYDSFPSTGKMSLRIALFCVLLPLVISWEQSFVDTEEAEQLRKSVVYLSSYNCDLSPSVCPPENKHSYHPTSCPYVNRRDAQIEIMQRDEVSDVMCLQGVWYASDLEAIVERTSANFPYSYSFLHDKNGRFNSTRIPHPPCNEKDTEILKIIDECEFKECHYSSYRTKIFKCIEGICKIKNIMQQMSETCLGCIFQGTERGNFLECTKPAYAFNPTGLLVLSRYKILKNQHELYHPYTEVDSKGHKRSSEIIQRGYLDIEVNHIGRVICTHLTEKFGEQYVEVANTFRSYRDKNFDEFDTLYKLLHNVPRVIVMGDLNASPSLSKGSIAPQFPENLEVLRDIGFQDPVADSHKNTQTDCSYCCGNFLVRKPEIGVCSKTSPSIGYIFDHVMVRGYEVVDTQEDYLKNNAVYRIFLVNTQGSAMSRHYGFTVPVIVG